MSLKSKMVKMVDVSDFSDFVQEIYGKPYNYQQQDGCRYRGVDTFNVPEYESDYENDKIPIEINGGEMGISFKAWLSRDPEEKFFERESRNNLFWNRNFYPHVSMIINDLHKRGLLEAGKFSIDIDW